MEQKALFKGGNNTIKSIIFTGRGNNEEEACEGAEVRYHTWKIEQKRTGFTVNEISIKHHYKKHNDVHTKCELAVEYTLSTNES